MAQQKVSQNENIGNFIQVWGLVKYKSAKSISGNFDADKIFLSLIDSVKKADERQFNQIMLKLISDSVRVPTNYNKSDSYRYFQKNVSFGWINGKGYNNAVRKQLTALSNAANISGKHHYIPTVWYEGDLPNEENYANYAFNEEDMNLLALAKAWNAIEYLFPYKYVMGRNWKDVLRKMIPVFRQVKNRAGYEKSILILAESINDTHAGEFMESGNMKMVNAIFDMKYYPPFEYKAEPNGIIVRNFLNDSLANSSTLKKGDVIVTINGKKIKQWLEERAVLLPASNEAVKYRLLSESDNDRGDTFAFSHLESPVLNLEVNRDGTLLNLQVVLLDRQNKSAIKLIENHIVSKRAKEKSISGKENIGADIALIRAGNFFEKDLPAKKDLGQFAAELRSKKAIICDMRKYPQAPGLFSYYLPNALGKAPFVFARYYSAYLNDPGVFKLREAVEDYMYMPKDGSKPTGALYTGKIIILTDENTQSMGEWFCMMLRQLNNNTTVIGSQTAGADGDVRRLTLPGSYNFSFTGNGIFYPDGKETQRIGIVPDIYFKPSAKQLTLSEDPLLDRALKYIREGR